MGRTAVAPEHDCAPVPAKADARFVTQYGHTAGVFAFLTILYAVLIAHQMVRRLWFDELFTYYIARQSTLPKLFDALTHTDLNPPLIYLVVRLCHSLFGPSEFATRLPGALSFYGGCMGVFWFLNKRIGAWWSAAGILFFWSTPYLLLATQARPYGLLIGFFALTLIAYGPAGEAKRNRWAAPAMAAGSLGMMLSHVFAPLSILPFCVAEFARSLKRRRIDWPVWAGLVLPTAMIFAYLPATRNFQKIVFPEAYQASSTHILYFFERLGIIYLWPWGFAAIGAALIAMKLSAAGVRTFPAGWTGGAWTAAILLAPTLLNFVLMRTAGAFWERYCITTAIVFYILIAAGMGCICGFRRTSAIAMTIILAAGALFTHYESDSQTPTVAAMNTIPQGLPIVAGSGLTFLEMDRYEKHLQPRLYYLLDHDAAAGFAHSTIFENMPVLQRYFPIRSQVSSYRDFVAANRHFLVLSRAEYMEVWVLGKLCGDGARIRLIQTLPGPDKPYQLYDVRFRP